MCKLRIAVLALLLGLVAPLCAGPPGIPPPEDSKSPTQSIQMVARTAEFNVIVHAWGRLCAFFFVPSVRPPHSAVDTLYAYCGGDPVNRADPSGLDWEYVDGERGIEYGMLWNSSTPGHWRYIDGSPITVPKPHDEFTPKDLGLQGNRFTQADYDRGVNSDEGPYRAWYSNFEQPYGRGGSANNVEYGPKGNRRQLHVGAMSDRQRAAAVHQGYVIAGEAGAHAVVDLNPALFVADRGYTLVNGQQDILGQEKTRGQAALELTVAAATVGVARYGVKVIDDAATTMVYGPSSPGGRLLPVAPGSTAGGSAGGRLAGVTRQQLGEVPNFKLVPEVELSVAPRPVAPKQYSVVFQYELPAAEWGTSSAQHMRSATEALHLELRAYPDYAVAMEQTFSGLTRAVAPGPRGGFSAQIPGFTWQHATTAQGGAPGVMQLVPRYQHTNPSPWWPLLHPDGAGGFAEWAAPLGAKR